MRTNSSVNRIWGNITSPNDKARAILATMHKGVAANGTPIIIEVMYNPRIDGVSALKM